MENRDSDYPLSESRWNSPDTTILPVAIYAAPDAITAALVQSLLESESIDSFIGEQVTQAYAPAFQVASGFWGKVLVRPEDVERATRLVAAFLEGQGRVSEEELEAAALSTQAPDV